MRVSELQPHHGKATNGRPDVGRPKPKSPPFCSPLVFAPALASFSHVQCICAWETRVCAAQQSCAGPHARHLWRPHQPGPILTLPALLHRNTASHPL